MNSIYQPAEDSYLMQDILKKEIPKLLKQNSKLKVLEIGCGSGIQLQTLKKLKVKNIFACDINSEAVVHCKKLGFQVVQSNLFSKIKNKFDLIIFNPPYLPKDTRDEREPEISRAATTGGKNGSEIINKFLHDAKKHLLPDGKIFLLTSSLTKKINYQNFKKKKLGEEKLFFERLFVWELSTTMTT